MNKGGGFSAKRRGQRGWPSWLATWRLVIGRSMAALWTTRAGAIGRGPRWTAPAGRAAAAGRGSADGRPRRRAMAVGRSSPGRRFGARENALEARAGSARRDGLDAWLTSTKGTAARWVRRRGRRRRLYRQPRRELGEIGLGLGLWAARGA